MLEATWPRPSPAGDLVYGAFAVLAAPAPYLVRALTGAALAVALAAAATLVSADALPGEPLYGVKVAWEQTRLGLAGTPADRAAVQMSVARHRLAEATRLAEASGSR